MFDMVWSTNKGCRAVTEMTRGVRPSLPGSTIIEEIKRCHGDDIFNGGERYIGRALRYFADALTPDALANIAEIHRKLALDGYLAGEDCTVTYRQAAHSLEAIALWQSLAGTGELLRPQQFMATSEQEAAVHQYPVTGAGGGSLVRFEINGFSSMPVSSRYGFKGEGTERVYTDRTAFKVEAARQENGIFRVELTEVPVSDDLLDRAYLLGL